jgi:PTS system ascorbate-specific IIA component
MLLADIVSRKHALFIPKADGWEDSIRQSCKTLVETEVVAPGYAEDIIDCVKANGPYIVLMPGIALPHFAENSPHARGTAIAFMKVEEPVSFDPGDPEKSVVVFFTLASVNTEQHLKNMRQLFKMLTNDELVAALQKVTSEADLLALDKKYS